MAITRAQQVRQMLRRGSNPNKREGASEERTRDPRGGGKGRQDPMGGRTDFTAEQIRQADPLQFGGGKKGKDLFSRGDGGGKGLGSMLQNLVKQRAKQGYTLGSLIPGQTKRSQTMQRAYRDYLQRIGAIPPDTLTGEEDDLAEFFVENAFDKTSPSYKDPITDEVKSIQNYGEFIAENFGAPGVMMSGNVGGLETVVTERDETGKPIKYDFRKVGGGESGQPIIPIIPQVAQASSNMDQETEDPQGLEGLRLAFRADGGPIGGIMDIESGRQMYFLGKLVKKATRAVKKIAKSPIGKIALIGGGLGLAGIGPLKDLANTSFGTGLTKNFLKFKGTPLGETIFGKAIGDTDMTRTGGLLGLIRDNPVTAGIVGTSIVAGLLTPKQEQQAQLLAEEEGIDIEAARNSILARAQGNIRDDFRARGFRAEGGPAEGKEPVAKKTMPLLDMGGQEMDLREEGGFVPIGRMEKADDVPARLSKNEFVFTADAVRNAGDGDVDKGAEVMYNMMKNLEAGGDVSEESQGLEGARRMFETSQRLEEVL